MSDPSHKPAPPEAWEPLLRLARIATRPLERFLQIQAASGILLLLAAAIALVCANSSWALAYGHFWHLTLGVRVGSLSVERSLEWVVNDVLMVIFFFVVGLEIRREIHHGELSDRRRAVLPAAAALGGMIAPALIFLAIARERSIRSGWGVPMATDIAFAVGILTLLGKRVPPALRVLLLALAVIDDLGAIVVIALFYSNGILWSSLLIAAGGIGAIYALQAVGVRRKWIYIAPGALVWLGVYRAGVHPTIAGVIIGLVTPVRAWLGPEGFVRDVQKTLNSLTDSTLAAQDPHAMAASVREINHARREAMSPVESLIETLHPWVAFVIMPLFALANAGVAVSATGLGAGALTVTVAVAAGLVIGKPLGVIAACWITTRLKLAALPTGLSLKHVVVLGTTAGIGFTMALFVAQLAYTQVAMLSAAKLGVLVGSAIAAVLGLTLGRALLAPLVVPEAAQSADEAESSTEK